MAQEITLPFGNRTWSVTIPADKHLELKRPESIDASSASPRDRVRKAVESPFEFEALRRALTPDDRIAVVFDDELPHGAELLAGLLDHLATAGISAAAVTVISPPNATTGWIDNLPDEFGDLQTETHNPADRTKIAYLGTTRGGQRVYLNRTVIDADFVIVLSGRGFDPVYRYAGAGLAIYPTLADEEIRAANAGPFSKEKPWNGRETAIEVARMLGTPFLVQVILGSGDAIDDIVAGLLESNAEGIRRQDRRWRATVAEQPKLAISLVSGTPETISFLDLAKAAACGARIIDGGRVVVLTDAAPEMGEGVVFMRKFDDPAIARKLVFREKPTDWKDCFQWTFAAKKSSLFLASGYPDEVVEELFATTVHDAAEVQRLIDAAASVVVIPDAHRMRVSVEGT